MTGSDLLHQSDPGVHDPNAATELRMTFAKSLGGDDLCAGAARRILGGITATRALNLNNLIFYLFCPE